MLIQITRFYPPNANKRRNGGWEMADLSDAALAELDGSWLMVVGAGRRLGPSVVTRSPPRPGIECGRGVEDEAAAFPSADSLKQLSVPKSGAFIFASATAHKSSAHSQGFPVPAVLHYSSTPFSLEGIEYEYEQESRLRHHHRQHALGYGDVDRRAAKGIAVQLH